MKQFRFEIVLGNGDIESFNRTMDSTERAWELALRWALLLAKQAKTTVVSIAMN